MTDLYIPITLSTPEPKMPRKTTPKVAAKKTQQTKSTGLLRKIQAAKAVRDKAAKYTRVKPTTKAAPKAAAKAKPVPAKKTKA